MERLGWVSSPRLLAPPLRSRSTLETHALAFRCRSLGTELRTPKVWTAGRGKRAVAFPSNFSLIATKPDVTTPPYLVSARTSRTLTRSVFSSPSSTLIPGAAPDSRPPAPPSQPKGFTRGGVKST